MEFSSWLECVMPFNVLCGVSPLVCSTGGLRFGSGWLTREAMGGWDGGGRGVDDEVDDDMQLLVVWVDSERGKEVGWLIGRLVEGSVLGWLDRWWPAFPGVKMEGVEGPSADSEGSDWTGRTSIPGME